MNNLQEEHPVSVNGTPAQQAHWALRIPALLVSYVFHPVFMPVAMAWVLFQLSPATFAGLSGEKMGMVLLRIAYIATFFPILTVLLLKGVGFIESIHLHTPKDRIIPLIGTMIFYFWVYHVFKHIDAPFLLRVLLLGCFWGVIVMFMVSIFFKVSMHTTGAGGMIGILLVLMFNSPVNMAIPFFAALMIAGIIGTARMILKAHTLGQIWLGYILGVISQVAAYWYLT